MFIRSLCIFLCFISVLSCGCASLTSPARKHTLENNRPYWFDYTAERRGAFLVNNSTSCKICAEPSPDVALEFLSKLKGDLNWKDVNATAESEFHQEVIQLAGRTEMILFLRESLYRLCELSINTSLSDEKVAELYERVVNATASLVQTELEKAEKEKLKAEKEKLKAEKEKLKVENENFKLMNPASTQQK